MTDDTPVSLLESRVDEVIANYLDAERQGIAPEPADLIAQHPDLAKELHSFFSDRDCFAQIVGPPVKAFNGRSTARRQDPLGPTVDLGRYVDVAPFTGGGLGDVLTATDRELHRRVALKRLKGKLANNPSSRRRFLLEAEVTARLEHPGVVPVHSLFHDDSGLPCYAMRFVEGRTLEDVIAAYHQGEPDPVAFRRLLQSFIQICETVAYAHSRGVLHRDLKPRNVMLGKFGETVVIDWGLAKIVGRGQDENAASPETTLHPQGDSDGSHDQTRMGDALGTPAYMSPEQAAGRWDVIDAASDVYNLGALLYAILTGRPPIDETNWPEMQQKIQRGDFPRPRTVNRDVPRPLEAVCLRAMAMKPEDRYSSARELAAEIERWLADEPVGAYPEPLRDRAWRWVRRHKGLVGTGISSFVAFLTLVLGTWIVILERENASTQRNARIAELLDREQLSGPEVQSRLDKLDRSVRANLDQLAARICQDSRIHADPDKLRHEVLRQMIAFWKDAAASDKDRFGKPTFRSSFYNLQRAMCLARLGEHEGAAALALTLEPSAITGDSSRTQGFDLEKQYDLVRVYALCASAATRTGATTHRYAEHAVRQLSVMATNGTLKKPEWAQRLRDDRDLDVLRSRDDFQQLFREPGARHE